MKITTIPYSDKSSFEEARAKLITMDQLAHSDSHLSLTTEEMSVAVHLELLKDETRQIFLSRGLHPAAASFVSNKGLLVDNPLYDFVKTIPKGVLQHIHSTTTCDPAWAVEKAQSEEDCYVYWRDDGREVRGKLRFYNREKLPEGYLPADSVPAGELYQLLTLRSDNHCSSPRIETALAECYERMRWFTTYEPVFEDYYTQAFLSMIKDNIQGAELRFDMQDLLYDLKGKRFDPLHMIKKLQSAHLAATRVGRDESFTLKIILSTQRSENKLELIEYLRKAFELKKNFPRFIAGYDISGNNNWPKHFRSFNELKDNIANIRQIENEFSITMPLFFHDNENFSAKDKGLYDAVLLECNRMGMSLNLFKFPELEKVVRQREMHVEVLPVSNQAKGYVPDLRIHPATGYFNKGISCTISSGDPGLFGYSGVSPDFWAAIVAWDLGLREVKQIIINSYASASFDGSISDTYSEKGVAYRHWLALWDTFINNFKK